jgi:histidyl-tRNA synthetase
MKLSNISIMLITLLQRRTLITAFQSTSSSRRYVNSITKLNQGRSSAAVTDKDLLSKTTTNGSSSQQEPLDTNPPKGTRDFYPPDQRLRSWLFSHFHTVSKLHGFSEYDAPVLESSALYIRKAGEEVTQQLYNFVDKGGREVTLRPEMTPSLARMVMAKKGGLNLPLKWYSIPQCWRYERMTRGRRREHYQWNLDVWGVSGVEVEAELIAAMVLFFKRVGLSSEDVGIKVNSRNVIGEVLTELGVPEEKFAGTCVLVDKLEKVCIICVLYCIVFLLKYAAGIVSIVMLLIDFLRHQFAAYNSIITFSSQHVIGTTRCHPR